MPPSPWIHECVYSKHRIFNRLKQDSAPQCHIYNFLRDDDKVDKSKIDQKELSCNEMLRGAPCVHMRLYFYFIFLKAISIYFPVMRNLCLKRIERPLICHLNRDNKYNSNILKVLFFLLLSLQLFHTCRLMK